MKIIAGQRKMNETYSEVPRFITCRISRIIFIEMCSMGKTIGLKTVLNNSLNKAKRLLNGKRFYS